MPVTSNKFVLKDYHAVENAEIILNGITVLAGINGCGKSTISRWLYGFVHYSNEFNRLVDDETANAIHTHTNQLLEMQRRMAFLTKQSLLPRSIYFTGNKEKEIATLREKVDDIISSVINQLTKEDQQKGLDIILSGLGLSDNSKESIDEKLNAFRLTEEKFLYELLAKTEERKEQCSIDDLFSMMERGLGSENKAPRTMQFIQDGNDLLDYEFIVTEWSRLIDKDGKFIVDDQGKYIVVGGIIGRFIAPLGLKRAIYIDSPMAISNVTSGATEIWNRLKQLLVTPLKPLPEKALPIMREIQLILGGEIIVKDELSSRELRYIRKSDGLNISIDEVATGMKAFTYILRLLQNGYLDSETVLIIDEPEVHLHPQWVVKFAKVLVLIQKYLGSKIMMASHNPDMVAAINAIATAEGLGEVTNFYQANRVEGSLKYKFEGTGNDISSIFDCFNVAIDKIDTYKPVENS